MLQHIVEGDHVEPLSVIQDLGKPPYPYWVFRIAGDLRIRLDSHQKRPSLTSLLQEPAICRADVKQCGTAQRPDTLEPRKHEPKVLASEMFKSDCARRGINLAPDSVEIRAPGAASFALC